MRLPNRSSATSESDEDYTETKVEEYSSDEEERKIVSNSRIPFRNIRRGTCIDIQDDDGNWYAAEVIKLDNREQKLFVTFMNSGESWDKWVLSDNRVARHNTFTYGNNGQFKVGQIVEYSDGIGIWKKGTITAISAEQNKVEVTTLGEDFLGSEPESKWITGPRQNIRSVQRPAFTGQNRRRWKVPSIVSTPEDTVYTGATTDNIDIYNQDKIEDVNKNFHVRQIAELSDRHTHYVTALASTSLRVVPVNGDGNCLFRAVAHQIYGNEELHSVVRSFCMDYMEADADFFAQFVEGGHDSFVYYVAAKRMNGCWGDDPEIQALSEIYDRPAEIWAYDPVYGARKLRTFHEAAIVHNSHVQRSLPRSRPDHQPIIKLSYYGGGHYDSIIDRWHSETVVQTLPGEIERAAIARCGQRRLNRSRNGNQNTNEDADVADLKQSTDAEATEREALDIAIQISRHEHLGWATEDLDTCLSMVLENQGATGNLTNDSTAMGSIALAGEALHDSAADLAAVQQDLLSTVVEESEREYIDKAILSSLTIPSSLPTTITAKGSPHVSYPVEAYELLLEEDSKRTEDQIIEQARLASLEELKYVEAQAYPITVEDADVEGFVLSGDGDSDPSITKALKLSELSEDEILHLAIEKSMESYPHAYYYSNKSNNKLNISVSNSINATTDTLKGAANVASRITSPVSSSKTPFNNPMVDKDSPPLSKSNSGHNIKPVPAYLNGGMTDEESMLQAAIRESLMTSSAHSSAAVAGSSTSTGSNYGAAFGLYEIELDEEEELNRAIANSLKQLQ